MSDKRFMVRFRRKPKGPRKMVAWSHRSSTSSWWGQDVLYADTPEEAVEKMAARVDFDKHTRYGEPMTMRVYEISDDYQEFKVGPSFRVEKS